MKSILFTALLLFSFNAFACPDLAGQYLCENPEGDQSYSISQLKLNGDTVYEIHGEGMIADGLRHEYEETDEDGVTEKGAYTATCSLNDNRLTTDSKVELLVEDVAFMRFAQDLTYSKKGDMLKVEGSFHIEYLMSGDEDTIQINDLCKKTN